MTDELLPNYTAEDARDQLLELLTFKPLPQHAAAILTPLLLHRDLERIAVALEGMPEKQRRVGMTSGLDALIESLKDTGGPK